MLPLSNISKRLYKIALNLENSPYYAPFNFIKGGGHANFDADFFVPMDTLGDA